MLSVAVSALYQCNIPDLMRSFFGGSQLFSYLVEAMLKTVVACHG